MFLKNKNIIFKIRRSKVTDYAALNVEVHLKTRSGNVNIQELKTYGNMSFIIGAQQMFRRVCTLAQPVSKEHSLLVCKYHGSIHDGSGRSLDSRLLSFFKLLINV